MEVSNLRVFRERTERRYDGLDHRALLHGRPAVLSGELVQFNQAP